MSSLFYRSIHHAGSFAVDGTVLSRPGADKCVPLLNLKLNHGYQ